MLAFLRKHISLNIFRWLQFLSKVLPKGLCLLECPRSSHKSLQCLCSSLCKWATCQTAFLTQQYKIINFDALVVQCHLITHPGFGTIVGSLLTSLICFCMSVHDSGLLAIVVVRRSDATCYLLTTVVGSDCSSRFLSENSTDL